MNTKVILAIFLGCLAILVIIHGFTSSRRIDFYQYWGVGMVQKWSHITPKSPYTAQNSYAHALNYIAEHSDDLQLRKVNKQRRDLQLLQTPLCFSFFTFFPKTFSIAFAIFYIIQIISFISAIMMLSMLSYGKFMNFCYITLLMLIFYFPVVSDLDVGNLNCLYLFGFVSILVLADLILEQPSNQISIGITVFSGMLIFFTLFKPNWLLVTALLTGYLVSTKRTIFTRVASTGVVFAAVLIVIPCFQFHSCIVWIDWYRYLRMWDNATLLTLIPQGNYSLVLLFSRILDVSVLSAEFLSALFLVVSILIVLIIAVKDKPLIKRMSHAVLSLLRDPHLMMATGITVTLILMPLVWFHYYTLAILPAFWIISPRNSWKGATMTGWISIVLISNIPGIIMRKIFGWAYFQISWGTVSLGLVPLWIGILAAIHHKTKSLQISSCKRYSKCSELSSDERI